MVPSSAASLTVVTERAALPCADALAGRQRDVVVFTAEERRWGRRRVRTEAGRELMLALPTGSVLTPGEVLHVDEHWYVVAEAAREAVLAGTPRTPDGALRGAVEGGNRHFHRPPDGPPVAGPDRPRLEVMAKRPWPTFPRAP